MATHGSVSEHAHHSYSILAGYYANEARPTFNVRSTCSHGPNSKRKVCLSSPHRAHQLNIWAKKRKQAHPYTVDISRFINFSWVHKTKYSLSYIRISFSFMNARSWIHNEADDLFKVAPLPSCTCKLIYFSVTLHLQSLYVTKSKYFGHLLLSDFICYQSWAGRY